jgi:hypothetical protein
MATIRPRGSRGDGKVTGSALPVNLPSRERLFMICEHVRRRTADPGWRASATVSMYGQTLVDLPTRLADGRVVERPPSAANRGGSTNVIVKVGERPTSSSKLVAD